MSAIAQERVSAPGAAPRTSVIFLASFVGTCIEQYDFQLYGLATALVFGKLFFPTFDPLVGAIAAFGTFAVGYIARPLGGIICGHFGDRIGRKSMLLATLVIMGLATTCIGLVPTYESIGIWAAVILTFLRLVQGLALGGEQGGALLVAVENAPTHRRGFYGSWPQVGAVAGLLVSAGAVTLTTSVLSNEEFLAWGWRLPFIASIVLVLIGVLVRLKLDETPAFEEMQRAGKKAQIPIMDLFRNCGKDILIVFFARLGEITWVLLLLAFSVTYITGPLALPKSVALNAILIGAAVALVTMPLFGMLSDRIGRRPLYIAGAVLIALFAWPYFLLLETRDPFWIKVAVVVVEGLLWPMMYGPQGSFFSELFATRVRYTGVSVGQQVAAVIGGGFTPIIASAILAASNGGSFFVALYGAILAGMVAVAVWMARETRGIDLASADPADGRIGDGKAADLPVTGDGSAPVRG
jgi:metabolite-proton symporter